MLIIRPCNENDLDDLVHLSHTVGKGMTSMPADEKAWHEKIAASAKAFDYRQAPAPVSTYFMVLEDTDSGHVIGTTAIYTGVGLTQPFYSYKVSTLVSSSLDLSTLRSTRVLSMVNDYTGATEIGSLYLLPEFRRPGVGQFLSRSRFLTFADFPERFGQQVIAELRGWQDEEGHSPLWEHLGKKFFGIEFQEAVTIAALRGSQFISDMMPKYPIYIDLLPEDAQAVIGKPHDSSAPALHMLKKEGFQFNGYVDLFDGGPSVQVDTSAIRSVAESQQAAFRIITNVPSDAQQFIVSNQDLANYRCGLVAGYIDEHGTLCLSADSAQHLALHQHTPVRFITMNGSAVAAKHAA